MDHVRAAKILALPTKLFLIHPERRKATVMVVDSGKTAGQILSEELARVEKAHAQEIANLENSLRIVTSDLGKCNNLSEIRWMAFHEQKARAEKAEDALKAALTIKSEEVHT